MSAVAYAEMTVRNAGFLSAQEQVRLRDSAVFVCGVGGMGGAAAQSLVRAGLGRIALADPDRFEASNLNRQVFATTETIGREKTYATADALLKINPDLDVEIVGADWVEHLPALLTRCPVVVNGMDDLRAAIALYREAARRGATVVDAYTSPLPSVTVVTPRDPRPEQRLRYPTASLPLAQIEPEHVRASFLREIAFVIAHTSSLKRIDAQVVREILEGTRARSSYAPVVISAGTLMAFEAVQALLGRPSAAGPAGYFLDLWSGRIQRPGRGWWSRLRTWFAYRALAAHPPFSGQEATR